METRARLKEAAQRLFALHGVEGVTVQQIVSAAEQRNNASLHYHFGSKQDLLKELVLDGARFIDSRRQGMLDRMESEKTLSVRSVIEALAFPLLEFSEKAGQYTYIRMIANLQLSNRVFLREAVGDTWNTGYRRCLAHLAQELPHLPKPILEQRLSLVGIYGTAIWAAWEAALDSEASNRFWEPTHSIANVIDTLQATLEVAPSTATLATLAASPLPHGDDGPTEPSSELGI